MQRLFVFFFAVTFLFSVCLGGNGGGSVGASPLDLLCHVRFFHSSVSLGKVNVYLDSNLVFKDSTYPAFTAFVSATCGSHMVSVADSAIPISEANVTLTPWTTLVLYGSTTYSVFTVAEQTASPGGGATSVTLVNALSDPENVTFSANFGNQNPTGVLNHLSSSTAFLPSPGGAQINFTLPKPNFNVSGTPHLLAYVVYTVFLIGPASVNATARFVITSDFRPGDVRFIQACPDCGKVNFTVTGVIRGSIKFGSVSNFTDAGPGLVQIAAVIPGKETLYHNVTMDPDEKTTIALSGYISDGTAAFYDWIDDLDSLPFGQAEIRFVHLLPKLDLVTFTLSPIGGSPVAQPSLSFGTTSNYTNITTTPTPTYYLQVETTSTPTPSPTPILLAEATYNFSSKYYTVFLIGSNATNAQLLLDDGANLEPVLPPLTFAPNTPKPSDDGLSNGAIAAIVICSVVGGMGLVGFLIWFTYRRRASYQSV